MATKLAKGSLMSRALLFTLVTVTALIVGNAWAEDVIFDNSIVAEEATGSLSGIGQTLNDMALGQMKNSKAVYHAVTLVNTTNSPATGAVGGMVGGISAGTQIEHQVGSLLVFVSVYPGYRLITAKASNGQFVKNGSMYTLSGVTEPVTVTITFTNTRPLIELSYYWKTFECGDAPYTLEDARKGITVIDHEDGDIDPSTVVIGGVDFPLTDPGEYTVTYNVKDSTGLASWEEWRWINIKDTTAPEITMTGEAVTLECTTGVFVEPGVSAWDICDGALDVVTTDDIDINVPGEYTVTYTAVDAANNSTTATRAVFVEDTTGPAITVTGDNPLVLDGVFEYEELGATALDACGDVDVTEDIVIEHDVNPLALGSYEVTYTVADAEGNESTATRTVEVKRDNCRILFDLEVTPEPAVETQPAVITAIEAAGSCSVGDLSYQWEKRGADKGEGFLPIPDADDSPMYEFDAVDFDDAGDYRCIITDSMVSESSSILTVAVAPYIPAVSGLGLLIASAAALAAGAVTLRKKRD
jgi:hypothetical protein